MNYYYDKENGCYQNLHSQITAIMKNANEGSIKTRYRYEAATDRFCRFLAEEYKLQKFENVKSKHIIAYAERLKTENKSAATIKTEIAGIRYFHRHSGSKNILIDNSHLNLEQRQFARIDKTWLPHEIDGAKTVAKELGRTDVYFAISFSSSFGLRLEEMVKLEVSHLKNALQNGELYTKGKNGQERYIQIRTEEQVGIIKEALDYSESKGLKHTDKLICDNIKGGVVREKRSLQNFITNNQDKFIDFNRTNIKDTNKIKASSLCYHGLRYYYCNNLYSDLRQTYDDKTSCKIASESLGHHRLSVTSIYLKE